MGVVVGGLESKQGYFTAPKVSPRTSCFWVSQPITRIGATASTEAADSFAQNKPPGLEYKALTTLKGAALALVRLMLQSASFQLKMINSNAVDDSPGNAIG